MPLPESWIIDASKSAKPAFLSPFAYLDPLGQVIYVSALERYIHRIEYVLNLQAKGEIDTATAQASLGFLAQQLQQTRHDLLLGSSSLN
ncbi:MAG: hypothetical protein Q6M04_10905 [Thermostichus sp. BF3_bins_97]